MEEISIQISLKLNELFDENASQLNDKWHQSSTYVEIPDSVNLPDFMADWTEVHDWIDSQRESIASDNKTSHLDRYIDVDNAYRDFRKQSQKEVNYLVKEFECRKSADAYARSGESKTGVLDTTKLHTYRYSEDIFKKVTVVPDGKNHGLIFLLDWSGSMQYEILPTVQQVLNLTSFCKKVQIPLKSMLLPMSMVLSVDLSRNLIIILIVTMMSILNTWVVKRTKSFSTKRTFI